MGYFLALGGLPLLCDPLRFKKQYAYVSKYINNQVLQFFINTTFKYFLYSVYVNFISPDQ